jgi:hypothetical protein
MEFWLKWNGFNCNYGLKSILIVTVIWKLKGHLW